MIFPSFPLSPRNAIRLLTLVGSSAKGRDRSSSNPEQQQQQQQQKSLQQQQHHQ
jgi:hypothetical protein